jgi:RNA polymerase sigma-70 factor (ECF subfamily)
LQPQRRTAQRAKFKHALSREALKKPYLQSLSGQETDQQQLAEELAQLAQKAISKLPPRTQAVFKLIRTEEMSYKEVAETLHISTKAVEKEMMKALRLLRQALKDYLPILLLSSLLQAIF